MLCFIISSFKLLSTHLEKEKNPLSLHPKDEFLCPYGKGLCPYKYVKIV